MRAIQENQIPREHFMEDGDNKGYKWQGPNRSRYYAEVARVKGKLYKKKKSLKDQDNPHCVVTKLEADFLECEVKWALGSIIKTKLAEGMAFQLSYLKS